MKKYFIILLLIALFQSAFCQVEILEQYSSYHHRSWGKYGQMENVTADNAGTHYLFVKNEGNTADEISEVKFFEGAIERTVEGMKIWPKLIQPGEMASITFKGNNAGFRLNDQIRVVVSLTSGQTIEQTITNTMSPFRIANVIPAQDYSHLKIYFRNDDSIQHEMGKFFVNGRILDLSGADKSMLVGGNHIVQPNEIAILIYTQDAPMKQLMPMNMSIESGRTGAIKRYTSAAIRLVDAKFYFGTWHSSGLNPENEQGRKNMRELMIASMHGPGNVDYMAKGYNDYFIETIWEPNFGDPFNPELAIPSIKANAGKPYISVWTIDDEPDLNDKDLNQQSIKNMTYWENDSLIPSYVNLAVQKKYNRYGWYADIVGMDHYAAPNAPNIIALTWVPVVGRSGEIFEALEYSEYLKFNTEPRRNWNWVQLAPGPWSQEPYDWTVNIQFWMHIMGGAKSLEFFVAQSQTKTKWPDQWEVARQCVKQLASIRNLILDGEYANTVKVNSNKIHSRALVGPEAMVVVVANNTPKFTWGGSFDPIKYNGTINQTSYELEFELPEWISPNQVYRVGNEGEKLSSVDITPLGGKKYRIKSTENLFKQSHVFVISNQADVSAPEQPIFLHAVDIKDSSNYTLSWDVPFDNYGILSYDLYRNGNFYKNVGVPILEVSDGYLPCPEIKWEVIAIDPSGNRSQANTFIIPQNISIERPVIASVSPDLTVNEGEAALFNLTTTGNYDTYKWQYNDGSGWKEASEIPAFTGINTPMMTIPNAIKTYDGWEFRCIAGTICFGNDTSDIRALNVQTSTDTRDPILAGVEIFPNPANNIIQIRLPQGHMFSQIGLVDALGRELQPGRNITGNIETFSLQSLASGSYFFKLMTINNAFVIPFIKQ